ncbi:MAG TPA: CBS domain-containing protein [Nitrososphaerales archaeon]|nr:CBS domain-containing protein [Nitrososphaerales archaeon]
MDEADTVGTIMSRTVRTASSGDSLNAVMAVMVKYDIGSVVVTEGGKPVGIVTERDIVRRMATGPVGASLPNAGNAASKPLITVPPEEEIWEAFGLMLEKKIRRLLVLKDGKLEGIVTERDLFKWVVRVIYEPNIPERIKGLIAQNP